MNTHVKIVAILHIISGALCLIGALVIFAIFGTAGGVVGAQGEHAPATIIGIVGLALGGFLALLSLPGIIGGWGLLAGKHWARLLVIVAGVFHLLNFPLGTALGVYTLWTLLKSEPAPPALG
jgi:hypothetical protein